MLLLRLGFVYPAVCFLPCTELCSGTAALYCAGIAPAAMEPFVRMVPYRIKRPHTGDLIKSDTKPIGSYGREPFVIFFGGDMKI